MNHKIKIVSAVTASLLSCSSFATQETLTGTFTTLQAVSILPTATELVINGMQLQATNACTLAATDTGNGYLGDVVMRLGSAEANAVGSATTTTTGATCVTSTSAGGIIGLYEITGAPGATVNVPVVDTVGGDIEVAPTGCVGDYDGGANGDDCDLIDSATPASVRLADPSDTGGLGEGTPISGTTLVALGAVATVNNTLTAGNSYPVTFEINVTY